MKCTNSASHFCFSKVSTYREFSLLKNFYSSRISTYGKLLLLENFCGFLLIEMLWSPNSYATLDILLFIRFCKFQVSCQYLVTSFYFSLCTECTILCVTVYRTHNNHSEFKTKKKTSHKTSKITNPTLQLFSLRLN